MPVAITLFYASLLAIVLLVMSWRVVALRRGLRVGLGSGGQKSLELAIRAHANFTEYVPLALIIMLLLEGGTAVPGWLLHVLGTMLVVGRLMHGLFGLNRGEGKSIGRFWGTFLTWLMLLTSAALGLYHVIGGWLTAHA